MEALAFATASAISHSMTYQVAGKLILTMEGVISMKMSHPNMISCLKELDLKASLSTIRALLEDLKPILSKCGKSLHVACENLNGSVNDIQTTLDLVETKCKKHAASYWSYWSTHPDISLEIGHIESLKKIMDHRIDLLTKSATIELQLMASLNQKGWSAKNQIFILLFDHILFITSLHSELRVSTTLILRECDDFLLVLSHVSTL